MRTFIRLLARIHVWPWIILDEDLLSGVPDSQEHVYYMLLCLIVGVVSLGLWVGSVICWLMVPQGVNGEQILCLWGIYILLGALAEAWSGHRWGVGFL